MSSTAKVMTAVVKNSPKQYFNAKENWNLDVVSGLSISVNLWNRVDITNLLNRITKNNVIFTVNIA